MFGRQTKKCVLGIHGTGRKQALEECGDVLWCSYDACSSVQSPSTEGIPPYCAVFCYLHD